MINIDDRLLDLIPKIGADSFVILCLIAKRINKKNEAFPSRATLQKESGFGEGKVDKCLKILKENNLLSSKQRHVCGKLSSCLYGIETDYVGVFVSGKNYQFPENSGTENQYLENQTSENQTSENERTENRAVSIKQSSLSINQDLEVLNIIPDFSENCTDLSANADDKNNFSTSNFSFNQSTSRSIEETTFKEKELEPEKKKPSRSARRGKNPFEIDYTEGFIKFWKAFSPHGSKGQSFDYWKEFKLEAQTERVLKALELYHLELQAQPWREKIHGERFLKNLLPSYFDKLEDPKSLVLPVEKQKERDAEIQRKRDEIRPKWMDEMADRQKNKEKTIEFNDWLAENNMPELIKVYTYVH